MRYACLVVMLGCGHPPAPKPAAVEHPVTSAADVAGRWVTSDDMDFGYVMTIGADGAIDVVIDRGRMGRCEQKGKLELGTAATFTVTFAHDECHRDVPAPAQVTMKVASFTGDALSIALTADGLDERHVYRRAPPQ